MAHARLHELQTAIIQGAQKVRTQSWPVLGFLGSGGYGSGVLGSEALVRCITTRIAAAARHAAQTDNRRGQRGGSLLVLVSEGIDYSPASTNQGSPLETQ